MSPFIGRPAVCGQRTLYREMGQNPLGGCVKIPQKMGLTPGQGGLGSADAEPPRRPPRLRGSFRSPYPTTGSPRRALLGAQVHGALRRAQVLAATRVSSVAQDRDSALSSAPGITPHPT